ncbi:MAG TPA: laccase domain-containing protein [Actinomycetales bacterium]|nr:laccase domain-containing protein [Actinomycetales bacterium]
MILLPLSPGARALYTTRSGGVSRPPYAGPDGTGGLNLGGHVGDDPAAVAENRARLARRIGAAVEWMDQVHGRDLCVLEEPSGREVAGTADALIVGPAMGGHAPGVLVADCVPLLLATESGSHRAAVHVGRRGLALGVAPAAVEELAARSREPVHAAVGPHICGRCYEVSEELSHEAGAYGADGQTRWGTPSIDLLAGIRRQLDGVPVAEAGLCTLEDERFYSYRREGTTGRCAGIALIGGADTP